jgi:hypothetical protein
MIEGPEQGMIDALAEELAVAIREEEPEQQPEQPDLIAIGLFGDTLRLVSLTPDGEYRFVDDTGSYHEILYINPETLNLKEAADEFEFLINNPATKEQELQNFLEKNPLFIENDEYKEAHPHLVLEPREGPSLIPDFILEPLNEGTMCDLLELKLPSTPVFVLNKGRARYSAAVLNACAQLREYRAFFDDEENRKNVYKQYGVTAYKPRMFVIIGRKQSLDPLQARRAENDIPGLFLRTYDDILARMKKRISGGTRLGNSRGRTEA